MPASCRRIERRLVGIGDVEHKDRRSASTVIISSMASGDSSAGRADSDWASSRMGAVPHLAEDDVDFTSRMFRVPAYFGHLAASLRNYRGVGLMEAWHARVLDLIKRL